MATRPIVENRRAARRADCPQPAVAGVGCTCGRRTRRVTPLKSARHRADARADTGRLGGRGAAAWWLRPGKEGDRESHGRGRHGREAGHASSGWSGSGGRWFGTASRTRRHQPRSGSRAQSRRCSLCGATAITIDVAGEGNGLERITVVGVGALWPEWGRTGADAVMEWMAEDGESDHRLDISFDGTASETDEGIVSWIERSRAEGAHVYPTLDLGGRLGRTLRALAGGGAHGACPTIEMRVQTQRRVASNVTEVGAVAFGLALDPESRDHRDRIDGDGEREDNGCGCGVAVEWRERPDPQSPAQARPQGIAERIARRSPVPGDGERRTRAPRGGPGRRTTRPGGDVPGRHGLGVAHRERGGPAAGKPQTDRRARARMRPAGAQAGSTQDASGRRGHGAAQGDRPVHRDPQRSPKIGRASTTPQSRHSRVWRSR